MKTPPHLAHLYDTSGRNTAPVIKLSVPADPAPRPRAETRPIAPPIRTGPGALYATPPPTPTGLVTR